MQLTVIRADGVIVDPVEVTDNENLLGKLQVAVGGFIEIIPHLDQYNNMPAIAYCNDDGKYLMLGYNAKAQAVWAQCVSRLFPKDKLTDYLCGNVAIITGTDEEIKIQRTLS